MEMTANKKRKLNEQNDIHFATSAGNFEMVRLSMENGANIESRSKDKYRNTPLMIAAKIGYIEIVNFRDIVDKVKTTGTHKFSVVVTSYH